MPAIFVAIRAEFLRYKALAEGALGQLEDNELTVRAPGAGNSLAIICWHVSGNLRSRFTEFLSADGEKTWRRREEEFQERSVTRAEVLAHWEQGWAVLLASLDALTDADLAKTVKIRSQPLEVSEALLRSLAHLAYHVGQIVFQARVLRGSAWRFLSIPPGQSEAYNAKPAFELAEAHAAQLRDRPPPEDRG